MRGRCPTNTEAPTEAGRSALLGKRRLGLFFRNELKERVADSFVPGLGELPSEEGQIFTVEEAFHVLLHRVLLRKSPYVGKLTPIPRGYECPAKPCFEKGCAGTPRSAGADSVQTREARRARREACRAAMSQNTPWGSGCRSGCAEVPA